jgi:hypothetical protein
MKLSHYLLNELNLMSAGNLFYFHASFTPKRRVEFKAGRDCWLPAEIRLVPGM